MPGALGRGGGRIHADAVAQARAEVRRCASCGNPALVCVHAWQHSVNGVDSTMVTRECQCQACGATTVLHPRWKIIPLWIITVLLLPTLVPPLVSGFMAFRRGRAWRKNPIVPDAPMPRMRYKSGPGHRRCDCGGTLVLGNVTRNSHNGIPTGTEYVYNCAGCKRQITLESLGGRLLSLLGGGLLALLGAVVLISVQDFWWRWGGGLALGALGLFLAWQAIARTVGQLRYPELPSDLL